MKPKGLGLVFVGWLVLFCGCASQEVSHRSLVTALEVKASPQGYHLAVEYLKKTSAEVEQRYGIYEGQGRTFLEALGQIEEKEGAKLYLDSAKCLLVAGIEDKEGFAEFLREMDRDGRLRPHIQVAFSRGHLAEKQNEDFSAGQKVAQLLSGDKQPIGVSIKDALNCLTTPGRGGMIPIVAMEAEDCKLENFVLVGERALTLVEQRLGKSLPMRFFRREAFVLTGENPGVYDVQLEKTKVKIQGKLERGVPRFVVTVGASGYLRTAPRGRWQATTDQLQVQLAQRIEQEFTQLMEEAVHGLGADIFSLGKNLSFHYPKEWQELGKDWGHILQNVEYQVIAKVKVQDKRRVLGR